MKIFHCIEQLHQIALDFELCQSFSPSYKLVKSLLLAKTKEYIYIIMIFKKMLKLNDITMIQRSVYFYFWHELSQNIINLKIVLKILPST